MKMMLALIRGMRPRQMVLKNGVVFAALVFAKKLTDGTSVLTVLGAFAIFAALSAAVYLFNDVRDAEQDRRHPEKKNRPVASGELPAGVALIAAAVLCIAALVCAFLISRPFGVVAAVYLAANAAYSLYLKHVVIIDVMIVSFGFLLRVVGGGVAISVPISGWLIICTLLLALFLGFSKRRHEISTLGEDAEGHRKILTEYSPYFLDQVIGVVTSATLVAYMLYTMDAGVHAKLGTVYLPLTIPFVLYGIFRYLYLVHLKEKGGDPARVLVRDLPLFVNVALWVLTVYAVLYHDVIVDKIVGFFRG